MTWIKIASNATSLLLCFLGVLCIVGAENDVCVPSIQTECFNISPNSAGIVRMTMLHGKELNINVNGLSGSPVCSWIRGNETMTSNKTHFTVMPDSGQFTLTCSDHNMIIFSKTVVLHVLQKRPTKPQLLLTDVNIPNRSPRFLCISEDISEPQLEWSKGRTGKSITGEKAMSKVSTSDQEDKELMCCATNTEGQECTQLYDYDFSGKETVSNVTLSPGDSLLLCCKIKTPNSYPDWKKDGEQLNLNSLKCQNDQIKEMCLITDSHYWKRSYLSIPKVSEKHSGTYTCRLDGRDKSFHVQVLAEGFISAQLDERLDVLAEKKTGVCLEAKLSYHPTLQLCSWEDPDGNVTKCTETWETKHRTVKFCNLQKSGIYKLFVEAAGKKETKEIKVYVTERPTKPQLLLTDVNIPNRSPRFLCISEDISKPQLEWSKGRTGKSITGEKAMSKVSTSDQEDKELMCCATNTEGQECTQLYDYDFSGKETVSNVTLSPGDSLLLCCKIKTPNSYPDWRKDGEELNLNSLKCQNDQIKEMCLITDSHYWKRSYLSIPKVSEKHSGTYTCRLDGRDKSFHVQVLAEGFISAQLDERLDVLAEKKTGVCLEAKLSYHPTLQLCSWEDPDGNVTKCTETWETKHRTVKFCNLQKSGIYKLFVEAAGKKETKEIKVYVTERPTKPQLLLTDVNIPNRSPRFLCISEDISKPQLEWSKGRTGKSITGEKAMSKVSTSDQEDKELMCCATNTEGQECTQLYDYDFSGKETVSNVTLSPGDSLLLCCKIKTPNSYPDWRKDGEELNLNSLKCQNDQIKEMCLITDSHYWKRSYLSIPKVSEKHSGTYTCRLDGRDKSFHVQVLAEGFISAQLDERLDVLAEKKTGVCLEAKLSYHPTLQLCSWEDPDGNVTKCTETWETKHRTVKFCNLQKSGIYKLFLEAAGKKETKEIKVCVADKPEFRLYRSDNSLTYVVESVQPVNFTWRSCESSNDSCKTNSSWKDVDKGYEKNPEELCVTKINKSLNGHNATVPLVKFCVTNSLGSWCDQTYGLQMPASLQPSTGFPHPDNSYIMPLKVGIGVLLLALAIVVVSLIFFVQKKKQPYQPQLQMIQMVGPNDNDYIYINFKDFEYNKNWEFPRENLELGKELGSGAFGMVVQATAYGINKPGVSQQVAVKMLKEKHQSVEKEALMSELKMLTHIGHHTNIVNLLGACTELGPIYLIFQYCCYGDLLNYLKKNSNCYYKSVTDAFNKDRFKNIYCKMHLKKTSSEHVTTMDNYVPMHSASTREQENIALLSISSSENDTCEDPEIFESADDQTEDPHALTFDDLLFFALQVAKGMEFLSSKNCIHRDLAARNVLLAKGRMAKIGDFGLARDIDNDSNYVVRGNVRLPVKWMAPESIFQGIYTTKSDVWAYGVLLWEIFSLGVTPYPSMKVDHTFYSLIEKGFKMDCPYHASESVYKMMCQCWDLDPCNRPSFSKLVSFMEYQLMEREEELYHNMPNQTDSDYQNAQTVLDISALIKENENKESANDIQAHTMEKSQAEPAPADEKLLMPSDSE